MKISQIVTDSIVQQKIGHVSSAATISAGVTAKVVETEVISQTDMIISMFGDAAVVIAPVFTLFLFYKSWSEHKLRTELVKIQIANEGRRRGDK